MTDKELMQKALGWLDDKEGEYTCEYRKLIEAIKARLAQPETYPDNFIDALKYHMAINEQTEQEPVAWCIVENGRVHGLVKTKPAVMNAEKWQPLYTAPPKKEWVGLTHTELEDCILISEWATWIEVGRTIEQALKDKNNG